MSLEQKNTSVDTMERLRGMVVFYSSPLPKGSTAQFRKSPSLPVNSHARETESVGVSMQLHQLCRTWSKRPISLLSHPEYRVVSYTTGKREEAGRAADRNLRGN